MGRIIGVGHGPRISELPEIPGSLALPNEPAGFTTLSDNQFNEKGESGTWFVDSGNYSLVSDPADPMSTGTVGQARYPEGYVSGGSAGTNVGWNFESPQPDRVYVAFWVKLLEGWQWHSSSVNKIGYLYTPGYNSLVPWDRNAPIIFNATANPTTGAGGEYRPDIRLQEVNMPESQWNRSPNIMPEKRMQLGQWHFWESVIDLGSPGGSDGRMQWWVDGDYVADHDDLSFIPSDGIAHFVDVAWFPIWGGRDDIAGSDQFMRLARLYVSAEVTT